MSVKISELPILDSLADNDVIAGVDTSANVTSKIEMATLKNYIDTNTQYTAGTNIDITNNVVSAPNVYNKNEIDTQIEELQNEVDSLSTIFNAFPTESGEGESVTLDDTAEVKFKKFDLKGNTSQDGTPTPSSPIPINVVSGDNEIIIEGKNLLGYPTAFEETTKGVKVTQSKGVYTLSGTSDSSGNIMVEKALNNSHTIKSGDYLHLENSVALNTLAIVIVFSDGTNDSAGFITENRIYNLANKVGKTIVALRIYCNTANVAISMQLKPMILNGIDTSTEFIEYKGNTYNINLPVENLFDISTITENKYINTSGGLSDTSNSNTSDYIEVKANQTYTLSWDYTPPLNSTSQREIVLYNSNKTFVSTLTLVAENDKHKEFTPTQSGYIRFDYDKKCFDIQLEKGSKQNNFTPYGTTPIELCSNQDGTKRDYFLHDKTLDKWYWHREIGKLHLTSCIYRNPNYSTNTKAFCSFSLPNKDITHSSGAIDLGLCNNFGYKSGSASQFVANNNNGLWWESGTGYSYLLITLTDASTLAKVNEWLSTNSTYIYYVLATPTDTEITYQPLIDQLNLLEKAMSKDSQTNISQVNNDLGFVIYAEAIKSLENVLDRIELLES